jgi:hypothetical protein
MSTHAATSNSQIADAIRNLLIEVEIRTKPPCCATLKVGAAVGARLE